MPVSSTASIYLAYLLQGKAALLWKDVLQKTVHNKDRVRNMLKVGG